MVRARARHAAVGLGALRSPRPRSPAAVWSHAWPIHRASMQAAVAASRLLQVAHHLLQVGMVRARARHAAVGLGALRSPRPRSPAAVWSHAWPISSAAPVLACKRPWRRLASSKWPTTSSKWPTRRRRILRRSAPAGPLGGTIPLSAHLAPSHPPPLVQTTTFLLQVAHPMPLLQPMPSCADWPTRHVQHPPTRRQPPPPPGGPPDAFTASHAVVR